MQGLATEPADRFPTAESFGVALAEASTQAWGPGWLSAEQVPILDAGPIISAAGHPSAPPRAAPPTVISAAGHPSAPDRAAPPTVRPESVSASTDRESPPPYTPASGSQGASTSPGAPAPETTGETRKRQDPARRRLIIAAVVVAVIVVATIAIFVLPKLFTVYQSPPAGHPSGAGPWSGRAVSSVSFMGS